MHPNRVCIPSVLSAIEKLARNSIQHIEADSKTTWTRSQLLLVWLCVGSVSGLPVVQNVRITVADYAHKYWATTCKLGSRSDSQFGIEFRGQVHHAVLDDQRRFPDVAYVRRGVAIDQHNVGQLSRRN